MPASNERVPNKGLTGRELAKIVVKDVQSILERDGMFSDTISFSRVSYEVRVSLHLDNAVYPEHISTTLSRPASIQEVQADPALATIQTPPLADESAEGIIYSEERHREIASPNVARIEHDLPINVEKKNLDTGQIETKEIHYTGDVPDPADVGNKTQDKSTNTEQGEKWGRETPKKGRGK